MSREGKNINLARRYAKAKGQSVEMSWRIVDRIRTDIPNSRIAKCKFLQGITRLYLDGQLSSTDSVFTLNRLLPYIGSDAHVKEYDYSLNGLSLETIAHRFSTIQQQDSEYSRKLSYEKKHTANTQYKIVRISDFESAKKYGQYTDWCITRVRQSYDLYTYNGAIPFYFCLINGFETISRGNDDNCPLDEYGLSMIAVSVDEYGDPHTITSRWNHENGGSDHVMSKDDLEDLLGVNFYETFKPFTEEELLSKGILTIKIVNKRLANGENIAKIFGKDNIRPLDGSNGLYGCLYKSNSAIYNSKTNEVTCHKWLDDVDNFYEGFALISVNERGWSFINRDGQLIGDGNMWFDDACGFNEGFARVSVEDKGWSFIDANGQLIGNGRMWFGDTGNFNEGFAPVKLNGRGWSFINRDFKLIENGQLWFDYACSFNEGFAPVYARDKGYSYINRDFKLIENGQLWFDYVYYFVDGFARVYVIDKGYSFINRDGQLIGDGNAWFDWTDNFVDGFACVNIIGKGYSFINHDGQLIENGKLWFDYIVNFVDGFARVKIEGKGWSLMSRDGTIVE